MYKIYAFTKMINLIKMKFNEKTFNNKMLFNEKISM